MTTRDPGRNYRGFLWHAAFLALTVAFTDINTVLPSMVMRAGGTAAQIGLLTAIMVGGPLVGQLLFASYLHLKQRKKAFLLLGLHLRVLALAGSAVALFYSEALGPPLLIVIVFGLMTVFALSGAFAGVSYTDILGKSLSVEQRGQFFVSRQVIVGFALLVSAPTARWILSNLGYPVDYVWLFAIAAGLLLVASAGFWIIREPLSEPDAEARSALQVLRSVPGELRRSPQLRRYIAVVNLTGFGLTTMPFYIALASERYELTGGQVGTYLLVQIVGMIVSNWAWSRIVSRLGFRGVLRACIVCGTTLPLIALVLVRFPVAAYLVVFFLMGAAISARKIAFEGMLIEITTNANRALHQGIAGAMSLTTALFPLVAGAMILAVGYPPVFVAVSVLVASAWIATRGLPTPVPA